MDYKIACWNIRSMNKLKKKKEVAKLINEEGLSVCAVIETHLKPNRINETEELSSGGSSINEDMQEFIDCLNEVEAEDINSSKEFIPIIEKGWNVDREGHYMFKVAKKLRMLNYPLRKLAWKNGSLHDRVEKCRGNLISAQVMMEKNPHDD
ncbi:RNA-directed DNA polymerase, eukaryota, reverse transcriptase zinc-binding domain protein [Tanacetum coccineum]